MSSRWYKREPAKFIGGVVGLGADVIGAYAVIIDLLYEHDGPIENNAAWIGGILGCSSRKARSLIELLIEKGKLHVTEGMLSNEKASEVIEDRANQSRNTRETVVKQSRTDNENNAAASENNDLTSLEREKEQIEKTERKDDCPKPKRVSDDAGFEKFWKAYPACPNNPKKPAKEAWRRATREPAAEGEISIAEQIMQGLVGYRKWLSEPKQQGHAVCHATTWLNQQRWEGFVANGVSVLTTYVAVRGSPQHTAWLDHYVTIGKYRDPKAQFLDKLSVPTEWPNAISDIRQAS